MSALTPDEVAARWGVHVDTIRQMVRDGTLRHMRLGKKIIRIPMAVVEEYELCLSSSLPEKARTSGTAAGLSEVAVYSRLRAHLTGASPKKSARNARRNS